MIVEQTLVLSLPKLVVILNQLPIALKAISLTINADNITIETLTQTGAYYALQTLHKFGHKISRLFLV